jgi:predicted DNA-binding protein
MGMAKSAALSIRIPEDVKQALEAAAAEDRRSLAQYVLLILEAHLQERERARVGGDHAADT